MTKEKGKETGKTGGETGNGKRKTGKAGGRIDAWLQGDKTTEQKKQQTNKR